MSIKIEELEIRNINEDDLSVNEDIIIDLLDQNYKINFPFLLEAKKSARDSYNNMVTFNKKNMAVILGAFYKKNVVGILWAYERSLFCDKRYHIRDIVINQMYRNKGIGKKLINKLEYIAKENSIAIIELMATPQNNKAMLFYRNNGFDVERVQLYKKIDTNNDD